MIIDLSRNRINRKENIQCMEEAMHYFDLLHNENNEMCGWVNLPNNTKNELLIDIEATAAEIRSRYTMMIVIGVGGSFLGAKAVIDSLKWVKRGCPFIEYAGHNMTASHMDNVLQRSKKEMPCICVISKSGGTLETSLAYSIIRESFIERFGVEETNRRTYVITDADSGKLRTDSKKDNLKTFDMPKNIGGRYSVLTAVGLLPIAVAGHDIRKLLEGAKDMSRSKMWKEHLLEYPADRIILNKNGKAIEVFEYFESKLGCFGEWLKQLFGETEGKDGKGIYPTSLHFSRDLHSMGQFLQEGNQIFFETIIVIKESSNDFIIPESAGEPYAGKSLEGINACAEEGVIRAHNVAEIPINVITVDKLDEYGIGELIYFFEISAAISAYLFGVNPFNQPGVESYKSETKKLIEEM